MPGYHLDKRHRNTVTIDGSLPDTMIADMIEDSYDLVREQAVRGLAAARWPGAATAEHLAGAIGVPDSAGL